MNQINKAILVPLFALVALILKANFGIKLSDSDLNTVIDGTLVLIGIAGVFMHPKKDGGKSGY